MSGSALSIESQRQLAKEPPAEPAPALVHAAGCAAGEADEHG